MAAGRGFAATHKNISCFVVRPPPFPQFFLPRFLPSLPCPNLHYFYTAVLLSEAQPKWSGIFWGRVVGSQKMCARPPFFPLKHFLCVLWGNALKKYAEKKPEKPNSTHNIMWKRDTTHSPCILKCISVCVLLATSCLLREELEKRKKVSWAKPCG